MSAFDIQGPGGRQLREILNRSSVESRCVRALTEIGLKRWWRSRMPWLWGGFIGVCIWFDWAVGAPGPGTESWVVWISAGCLLGFLSGYDAFIDPRRKGYLRTILLQPVSRTSIVLGAFAASGTIALAGLCVLLAYLVVFAAPPPSSGFVVALSMGVLGTLGFAAYAEAGSLVLGRDAAAVLGLLVLGLGSGPVDQFLPAGTPSWVLHTLEGVFLVLPSSHRLSEIVTMSEGRVWRVGLVVGQIVFALALAYVLLGRTSLLWPDANNDQ